MDFFLPSGFRRLQKCMGAVLLAFMCVAARGAVIFDVFVGYGLGVSDGCVTEASWFPVTCEVQNNGPSFNGSVEISTGHGAPRVVRLELPAGTRKRFTVPLFCGQRSRTAVDAVLRSEKGKVVAEHKALEPQLQVDVQSPLIAVFPRKHGAIVLPQPARRMPQYSPGVTHLNAETFPENPIALEGIAMLYLHSSRAVELKAPQVNSLLAWLHGGGRLVLAVEQPGDVTALDWLLAVLPCELGGVQTNSARSVLHQWLARPLDEFEQQRMRRDTNVYENLPVDSEFENAMMPVVAARVRDGRVLAGSRSEPLIISSQRGRGELVVLLFSPELAPFNQWGNRSWFWARMARVPPWWLAGVNPVTYSSLPLDGVLGAMVDTKQIRKLPIGWLLLLLIVYLVVIGPLDQYWLKKINRQMLTWITFPVYVVVFSGLIYFIGYTLRSGETEWNELQIVDVVPHGGRADLRGRTYAAAYSPLNATYSLSSDQPYATFRGEVGSVGEQSESGDLIVLRGNSFDARISVPVWTSQLYVHDWWRQDAPPLDVSVKARNTGWEVQIKAVSYPGISSARLVVGEQVYSIYEAKGFSAGNRYTLARGSGENLAGFVRNQQNSFYSVAHSRKSQFGSQHGPQLGDILSCATAASFISAGGSDSNETQEPQNYQQRFTGPRRFDLWPDLRRGDAVFIALLPNQPVAAALNKFKPRLSRKDSVLRVITPIE